MRTDNHWLLNNDVNFKMHLSTTWQRHKSNYAQFQKGASKSHLEPSDLMMKEAAQKDLSG